MIKIRCPKCGSEEVGQFRMRTGPIWCCECGYRVEEKEFFNPFIVEDEDAKEEIK